MSTLSQFLNKLGVPTAAAGGTVDAITVTYAPAIALADGLVVAVVLAGANTSATPTFAPNGATARTIVKFGGAALVAGDLPAALAVAVLEYNLANTRWELLNPAGSVAGRALTDDASAAAQRTTLGLGAVTTEGVPLAVGVGGTGAATFTDGGVLVGNAASAVQATTAGTSGQVLTSNGAGVDPTFQALPSTGPTLGTEQATTSGGSVTFGSIPAGVRRITVTLVGVSAGGVAGLFVRLGDAGGVEVTGYRGNGAKSVSGAISHFTEDTTQFVVTDETGAAGLYDGTITLTLENSTAFTWVMTSQLARQSGSMVAWGVGTKTLSAELTQVQLLVTAGQAFDAGVVNIVYD